MRKFVIIPVLMLLWSCDSKTEEQSTHENDTESKVETSSKVIAGSDTELDLVHKLIEDSGNEILKSYAIVGGGSKLGIELFLENKTKFANSSVRMTTEEKQLLKDQGRYGLIEIVFALDAVAVITNAEVGVDSLSIFELKKVFKGEISNWQELGGENIPIKVYRRNDDSGTNDFFWGKMLQSSYADNATIVETNNDMLTMIETTPGSVGYLGVGTIKDKLGKPSDKVWAVNIYIEGDEAKSPYSLHDVVTDNYYLARPLYQYFLIEDKDDFKELVNFELSPEGQAIIKEQGFFPITEEYSTLNQFYLEKLAE
ncbi:MAG: substrate-binding domain-containing protein [Flavobacteriales bacterium]|nr:substrate-binding domain-containing protein [Flavobacteriales bacterium]